MDILNDLTKCNFYYYILGGGNTTFNKAYLIFDYLQFAGQSPAGQPEQVALTKDDICIEDAFIRRQNLIVGNKMVSIRNNKLKKQYKFLQKINKSKLDQDNYLNQKIIKYSEKGYLLVVQYLGSHIIKNFINNKYYFDVYNEALSRAAKNGHLSTVKYLINPSGNYYLNRKYAADIHSENYWALGMAIQYNHLEIVQYLVGKGADIHASDDLALRLVTMNNHRKIVQYLISVGANPNVLTAEQKLQFKIN